jgi:hypothetical protein
MKKDSDNVAAIGGCLTIVGSLVPAVGICLLLMGLIKHYLVDSWLIAIGSGLIVAFPVWGMALKWVGKRVEKAEQLHREKHGIIEGGDGEA